MSSVLILVAAFVGLIFLMGLFLISRYKRCPSDRILVISGKTGQGSSKCIAGGATFVWPVIQEYEYLDLSIIDNNAGNWNKNQGSMYGDTTGVPKYKRNVSTKDKIHWWDKPETILKYCTSPDLDLVVNAQKALFYYIKPNPQKLPTATAITDVNFELAQFKLRGGHKEKKV